MVHGISNIFGVGGQSYSNLLASAVILGSPERVGVLVVSEWGICGISLNCTSLSWRCLVGVREGVIGTMVMIAATLGIPLIRS